MTYAAANSKLMASDATVEVGFEGVENFGASAWAVPRSAKVA